MIGRMFRKRLIGLQQMSRAMRLVRHQSQLAVGYILGFGMVVGNKSLFFGLIKISSMKQIGAIH